MIPADERRKLAARARRRVRGLVKRLGQRVKGELSARFPACYAIVADAGAAPKSYLERILDHLKQGGIPSGALGELGYRINGEMGMTTILAPVATGGFVLKLPLHERARRGLQRELEVLREPPAPLAALLPKILREGTFDGQVFAAWSFLPGTSGERFALDDSRLGAVLDHAVDLLSRLNSVRSGANGSSALEDLRNRVASLAANEIQRRAVDRAVAVACRYAESIPSGTWCMGQGDFKLANCVFGEKTEELAGVIDWGAWTRTELPGYELAFLLTDVRWRRGARIEDTLEAWRQTLPAEAWALRGLARYNELTGRKIDLDSWISIMSWQWLKRLAPLADLCESKRFDCAYLDRMFAVYS
jgi:hypothetical protein